MPIDVNFFGLQVLNSARFRAFAEVAYEILKQTGVVEQIFKAEHEKFLAELKDESPLVRALLGLNVDRNAKASHERHYEIVRRAGYVYAWAAFERLMDSCIEDLCRWRPQRVVESHTNKNVELLAKVASGEIDREALLKNLVEREQRTFGAKSLSHQRDHFFRTWDVAWSQECFEDLDRIARRRNSAAHDHVFTAPPDAEITADMLALIDRGKEIADAVAKRIAAKDKTTSVSD